jgi:agmatinase
MSALAELAQLLRPSGGGLYLVSTGKAEQERLQQQLYGVATGAQVQASFEETLSRIASARGVILGVPSDVGAGFARGANHGPQGLRQALLEHVPDWRERAARLGLIDVGDVFCVPQLQHDEMLSAAQLARTRQALYRDAHSPLPVSPLSIAERAFELIFNLNPTVKPFVLGGDHSTALPVVKALHAVRANQGLGPFGIVQSDAHTDLLEERLGVRECFATWSWHANELLGRKGRLTQVGIRASGKPQHHWESTLQVRQFWAAQVRERPEAALDAVLAHVKATGVQDVYFSNDIDGTDAAWADATGTPEPLGLEPEWLLALIHRLGAEVGLLGGDMMEVAPTLTRTPQSAPRTLALAVRYLMATFEAALGTAA